MSGSVGLAEFYHPVVRFAEDILNVRKIMQQKNIIFLYGLYHKMIEQKGMAFDQDFIYSLSLFSFILKKRGKKKRRMNNKNCDQKSCFSARSYIIKSFLENQKD